MNNRELKFRVWYIKGNKFYYSDTGDLLLSLSGEVLTNYGSMGDNKYEVYPQEGDDFVIQQYTGMKDKNGKEIYEGDILREKMTAELAAGGGELSVGAVEYYCGAFFVDGEPLYDHIYSVSPDILEDYDVIGNVCENPELLK